MEGMDFSLLIDGGGVARLTVTASQWCTETPVGLRVTAGEMIGNMYRISIWIKGVSLIMTGSQRLQIILGGGLYYDVGQGEDRGGRLTVGQLQFLHVLDGRGYVEGLLLEIHTQRKSYTGGVCL